MLYLWGLATEVVEYVHDPATGLYRRVRGDQCVLVFSGEESHAQIAAATSIPCVVVKTVAEMKAALPRAVVLFADLDLMDQLDPKSLGVPTVGIIDGETVLDRMVDSLGSLPWVMSFVAASLLGTPAAREQINALIDHVQSASQQAMLGEAAVGRMALLTESNRREGRFERIRAYFSKHGVGTRALQTIEDVYEELVTNALYDAPFEAGYFKAPMPRTQDVELPRARACEISYGLDGDTAFLRVRDTFGALRRERLVQVLARCRADGVKLDESRGGAGLGLWRVFCAASTIAITVVPGRLTDIIVGVPTKKRGPKELLTASLMFETHDLLETFVPGGDHESVDNSVTLVFVA